MVLKRREAVPVSASLATIIVERVFDGVVMLGFVFLNLPELAKLTATSGFIGSIRTLALWGTCHFPGCAGGLPAGGHVSQKAQRLLPA